MHRMDSGGEDAVCILSEDSDQWRALADIIRNLWVA